MRQLGCVLRRSQSFSSGAMTTTTTFMMMPTSSLLKSSSSRLSSTSASKNGKTANSNLFDSVFVAKMTTIQTKMKKTTGGCLRALSSLSSSSERNLPSSNLLQVANAFANSSSAPVSLAGFLGGIFRV